jgi:hypothetical protein
VSLDRPGRPAATHTGAYVVAGVPCVVTASAGILDYVEETYGAYRTDGADPGSYAVRVEPRGEAFVLVDSNGRVRSCATETHAAYATLERLVRHVTDRLAREGTYAVHASALVHRGEAVMISGKSRAGKTTLALALVCRGLGILSDELALSAPDARTILPYRRGLHIRPGTPELIAPLGFFRDRPFHPLSGGFQWTLPTSELADISPSCLAGPAPLRHVVLLLPRDEKMTATLEPIAKGSLTVELARATTATAHDLAASVQRITQLLEGARCCQLRVGELHSSAELLLEWLDRDD